MATGGGETGAGGGEACRGDAAGVMDWGGGETTSVVEVLGTGTERAGGEAGGGLEPVGGETAG